MNPVAVALDPEIRAYLDAAAASGEKALPEMEVAEARAFMQDGQSTRYGHPSLSVERVQIAGVPARLIRPRISDGQLPIVVYLHGGGWVLGSPDTHAGLVQEIALRTQAAIVVLDYPLAPERPFPAAFEQCYAAAKEIASGDRWEWVDASRIAIAGDSAGGNLAAAVALHAAECGDISFALQALLCPAMDPDPRTESYAAFREGFGLTAAAMRWFWQHYAPDRSLWRDPRLSPLQASRQAFSSAPPAWILTAGCDVLRDEGERYGGLLWAAGTDATVIRMPGTIHNFPVIDALSETCAAKAARYMLADALNRALRDTESPTVRQPTIRTDKG